MKIAFANSSKGYYYTILIHVSLTKHIMFPVDYAAFVEYICWIQMSVVYSVESH